LKDKKLILIVNVASQCGLTPSNYQELSKVYDEWSEKGFEILAVPCNQFNDQESGTSTEIFNFVTTTYEVKFPLLQKVDVNGNYTHPLFAYLRSNSELYDPKTQTAKVIPWNFAKFFVQPDGKVIKYYPPEEPMETVVDFITAQMQKTNPSEL
jgi:glutathione peroxidase